LFLQKLFKLPDTQIIPRKNKKVVYTLILGDYDDLKEPEVVSEDFDYICFTDRNDLRSEVWKMVRVRCNKKKPFKRCANRLMIYPFDYLGKYELSVLVIGNILINCDISAFVDSVLPPDREVAAMENNKSDCIYIASQNVLRARKDNPEVVHQQMERYRREGYPEHNGLLMTGVHIRRHTENVIEHCRLWYEEVRNNSQRDQLSFNYIQWKHKLIDPVYFSNEVLGKEFILHRHNYPQRFS
jgi:hypothetical protein